VRSGYLAAEAIAKVSGKSTVYLVS
jgi:hypothetical protein